LHACLWTYKFCMFLKLNWTASVICGTDTINSFVASSWFRRWLLHCPSALYPSIISCFHCCKRMDQAWAPLVPTNR
jgi:hypothetical protein